ncbi:hypothetical protein OS493_019728 [Desmophyllum pertusum]|uniref:P-type ATPase A domain-containing protein n=1 Tax=Desmophyllum pertusum TaxID=174260 RepID=A0A9X0CSW8_9CNID|nr:hypothetical protein OS493_019728 [Desmophyllum pertusum]
MSLMVKYKVTHPFYPQYGRKQGKFLAATKCRDRQAHGPVSPSDRSGDLPTIREEARDKSPDVTDAVIEVESVDKPPTPPSSTAQSDSSDSKSNGHQHVTKLRVQNICCAMETKLVTDTLEPLKGVSFSFSQLKKAWFEWVAIAEIVFGIAPVLKKAFISVKTCTVDINILMLIAIAGTLAIQSWLEGAAVVYVYALADALQEFCMYKVQSTISGLMLTAPQVAILASTGESVPVESVTIGTAIAIRPGELIPLDGVVLKGRAAVDESSVSGESVPVEKKVGL